MQSLPENMTQDLGPDINSNDKEDVIGVDDSTIPNAKNFENGQIFHSEPLLNLSSDLNCKSKCFGAQN